MPTLLNILVSSYVIFLILALVDTGFMYFARFLFEKGLVEIITTSLTGGYDLSASQ